MGIYSCIAHHMTDKILLFMHRIRENDNVFKLLQVSMCIAQREIGTITPFFELPHDAMHSTYTPTWITHKRKECHPHQIVIKGAIPHNLPVIQHVNDSYIMDLACDICNPDKITPINNCGIFLQLLTTSDMTSIDCRHILKSY